MARLLESLQAINSPVPAQFEAWLHKAALEPLPGIFDVQRVRSAIAVTMPSRP